MSDSKPWGLSTVWAEGLARPEWKLRLERVWGTQGALGASPREGPEQRAAARTRRSSGHPARPAQRPESGRHADTTVFVSSSIRQDFDVPTNHLIGAHSYCTQVRGSRRLSLPPPFLLCPAHPPSGSPAAPARGA